MNVMTVRNLVLGCCAIGLGTVGHAEPVDGKVAKSALFKPKGAEVELIEQDFFTDQDRDILGQVALQQSYYGAIAVSPDDGVISNATVAAANYHAVPQAEIAALAACNDAKEGVADCVIVAQIRPKGWSEQPVQLSVDATVAYRKEYRRGKGPKAFAISASTGKFAVAKGEGAQEAAVEACNERADASDCTAVILD
ncbi:5-aminolevulic acid synthase [Algirhabdus cladophorae]|uniref:5-aminolevulic acid synthase n=1 Tax=Algirhabdus cladophorae TaxID=3377108 RepID=UPI003B84589F